VASEHAARQNTQKKNKAAGAGRPTRKKATTQPEEELSPKRRVELAQKARGFRGKPPSI
jgi:hypothetical protein